MGSAIVDEKYVSLTTYKRDGTAKAIPVWIADLGDGTVGFTTASSSYKVKRIGNDPRVVLQASDAKGNVKDGSDPVSGLAVSTTDAADFGRVKERVKSKYGIQFATMALVGKASKLIGKGSGTDCAVIVTLDDGSGD
jgi:PPOX class probable F420-dependent enzyme